MNERGNQIRPWPLGERIERDFWPPDEPRLLVRKEWGWGWTINVARAFGFTRRVGS